VAEADAALGERRWLADLERWDTVNKPAAIAAQSALAAVDVTSLTDDDLTAHLASCRDNLSAQIYNHFDFSASAFLPVGDFVASCIDWTGCSLIEALELLQGWAPVSSCRDKLMQGVLDALEAHPDADALLDSGRPAEEVLAALRTDEGVGSRIVEWLAFAGLRPLSGIFDLTYPIALEQPAVLVQALRSARQPSAITGDPKETEARMRARVAEEHRADFDERLGDARALYRLRDERAIYADVWATGLLRRAVLEIGYRLKDAGRVEAADHLIDAGYDEIVGLHTGANQPTAAELARRHQLRLEADPSSAPKALGEAAAPPSMPPMTPASMRLARSMMTHMGHAHSGRSTTEHEHDLLNGLPGNGGVYEGVARVINGTDDLHRLGDGEVLVAATTSEAFNLAMSFAGAVVSDTGGALSHTAVVCREYGIPAVTGCRDATSRIPDGATIRVDGTAGQVQILKRP
jgi:pyruvate,water dikinase